MTQDQYVEDVERAQGDRRVTAGILLLSILSVLLGIASVVIGPFALFGVFGLFFLALVLALPEYGIALFLSTFLMTYPPSLQGAGMLSINNVLGGIFIILLTYKVYREQDWWFAKLPELQIMAVIILLFALSGYFNAPDARLRQLLGADQAPGSETLRTVITRAAFTVFFVNFIRAPQHVRLIYVLALIFMVITALTGIRSVTAGGGIHGYRATAKGTLGTISAASNPNRLGMFAILAIAGLWYLMQSLRIPVLRILIIPTMVLLSLAVFLSASRSCLLGLGVCVIAIIIDEGLSLRQLLTFALAGVMLVSVAFRFVPEKNLERITNLPFTQSGETGEGAGSFARREYGWIIALHMFEAHPFLGVGAGNWELARFLSDPARWTAAAHNSYILALIEGGMFCLAAFLVLLWRTWRNLRFAEAYLSDPHFPLADLMWIVKSAKVSLIVLVFFSMFADLWQLVILFWLVGLGVVFRRLIEQAALEEALA